MSEGGKEAVGADDDVPAAASEAPPSRRARAGAGAAARPHTPEIEDPQEDAFVRVPCCRMPLPGNQPECGSFRALECWSNAATAITATWTARTSWRFFLVAKSTTSSTSDRPMGTGPRRSILCLNAIPGRARALHAASHAGALGCAGVHLLEWRGRTNSLSPSIATTAKLSAGWRQPPTSPAR